MGDIARLIFNWALYHATGKFRDEVTLSAMEDDDYSFPFVATPPSQPPGHQVISTQTVKSDGTALDSTKKKKSKQPKCHKICCVPKCHTTGYEEIPGHGKPSYHRIPSADNPLRAVWLNKIKRDEGPNFKVRPHTMVCSLHFEEKDMERFQFSNRRVLKPEAVPTIFDCWKDKVHLYKPKRSRKLNSLQQRRKSGKSSSILIPVSDEINNINIDDPLTTVCSVEVKVETAELHNEILVQHNQYVQNKSDSVAKRVKSLQEEIEKLNKEKEKLNKEKEKLNKEKEAIVFSYENLKPSEFPFYTGFPSKEVFDTVLELVNPGKRGENIVMYSQKGNESQIMKKPIKLSPANQFLLFLCRVRVGLFECDLAKRFNVSLGTVNMLIITWANFLYLRLGSLNIWPSREQVDRTMPQTVKEKYPSTRVIIDCTEIKTEMASSLLLKSKSYSNYKSSNTLKSLIGIAPCGSITFVGQLYMGNISDREITQRSGLLGLDFKAGDSVMAHKGFDIQDLLDEKGVKLNIPPFLGQYDQMTDSEVKQTQSNAAERIHVERAMNKIKNFHIFDQVIPMSLFGSINQIWTVCALLTLFQDPIISCPGNS